MSLQRDFYIKCLLFSVLASLMQPCLCIHFSKGERDLRSTWACWRGSVTLLRYGSVTHFGSLAAMSWSTPVLPHCCRQAARGWVRTNPCSHAPLVLLGIPLTGDLQSRIWSWDCGSPLTEQGQATVCPSKAEIISIWVTVWRSEVKPSNSTREAGRVVCFFPATLSSF